MPLIVLSESAADQSKRTKLRVLWNILTESLEHQKDCVHSVNSDI